MHRPITHIADSPLGVNAPAIPAPLPDPRETTAARLERVLLGARYTGYFALLAAYAVGWETASLPSLIPITVGALLQNLWVHWILYTREYRHFVSPVNFFLHLAKISLLVFLTGGDDSALSFLYLTIIIGYGMCSTHFRNTFLVTLLCAAAYAAVVLLSWGWYGMEPPYNSITIHFFGIFLCGWMMNIMGEMIRTVELDAQTRAQALASSEATLRTILNSTASPILVCQENELIADVNNRACEFLGHKRKDIVGRRVRSFLFDDGTLPNKFAALRSRGEYHGEAIVLTGDGEERDVVLHIRSFFRQTQRYFVAMIQDITEQKNVQEQSRQATLRLEAAHRELQKVDALRTEFFRTISQRLRSPLSATLGYTQMLLDEELGELAPEQRRALQSARRSVQRAFSLLDEALALEERGSAGRNGKGRTAAQQDTPERPIEELPPPGG